jgi:hypothetical protein
MARHLPSTRHGRRYSSIDRRLQPELCHRIAAGAIDQVISHFGEIYVGIRAYPAHHGELLSHVWPGIEESIGDKEAFPIVDLHGAARSTLRSAPPRPRADSRDAALTVPALPRRHGAPTSLPMGGNPESGDDCALGGVLLVRRCDHHFLGSRRLQILCLRPAGWRSPRIDRIGADSVGADATGVALYAQPLADFDYYPRCVGTFALRDLADLARLAHFRVR